MSSPSVTYDPSVDNFFNSPDYQPVVPDTSALDLPGQFDSMPGGSSNNGSYYGSDPSGMNMIYSEPAVNPTPTGGWQQLAAQVAGLAAQGMKTFSSGTPTPAIPPSRTPYQSTGIGSVLSGPGGSTNWLLIGGVIAVGIGAMIVIGVL